MKELLIDFLKKTIEYEMDFENLIEKPKIAEHGDFSLPVFTLAKELKKSPQIIAKELEEKLQGKLPEFLSKVVSLGPYLNFYINNSLEAKSIIKEFENSRIPIWKTEKPQKIVIEFPSPNTNKALHIGHSRNMLIGCSLSKILEKTGNKVIKTNINNDRGIAVCKAMLSYKLFGENSTPKSKNMKPDEFVSYFYILYGEKNKSNPELELDKKAQEMLVMWENGEKETRKLWEKMLNWVYEGYQKTYRNYKMPKFEKEYTESEIYDKGKDIVLKALNDKVKGFGKEEDGAVYVDLQDIGLDKKYLLRGDMTTLYMTQDIYLAKLKEKDFKADKYIFVVGQEQEYHFKVLFEILSRLKFSEVGKNYHFAYGYIYDENGKKFSSRLGNTIGADEIYFKIVEKAKENLLNKELTKNLSETELDKRAKIIGFGALSYALLKPNPISSINFSMENALSFEGETGPYIQYTYARIQSLIKKSKTNIDFDIDFSIYNDKEMLLIKNIKQYPEILKEAAEKYKISTIANYLLSISQQFNEVYQNSPILKAEDKEKKARLLLAHITGVTIKEGLSLLNIDVLDEM